MRIGVAMDGLLEQGSLLSHTDISIGGGLGGFHSLQVVHICSSSKIIDRSSKMKKRITGNLG